MKARFRKESPPCLLQRQGFTLLEVLVALAILSVGLLGLAGLQLSALQGGRQAFTGILATQMALQRLEELQQLDPQDPALAPGVHDDGVVQEQGVAYSRQYTVIPDSPVPGVVTLQMTLSWTDPLSGQSHQLQWITRRVGG